MSWRDQLQPASFRGVAFEWEDSSGTIGRRVEVHEYPKRDNHWAEDLGLSTGKPLRLRAFIVGTNYMTQRDRLIEALNKSGPGTLVHPRFGAMQVIALDDSTWTESTRNGGMATFDLVFVLAGEKALPSVQTDTLSLVDRAVNSGLTALQSDFEDKFKLPGFAAFVLETGQAWYEIGLDVLGKYGKYTGIATRFLLTLSGMRDSFLSLIRTPKILAENVVSALRDLVGESSNIQTPMAIQSELQAQLNAIELPVATTQSRHQQVANRAALIQLYSVAASLLAVQAITQQSKDLAVSRVDATTGVGSSNIGTQAVADVFNTSTAFGSATIDSSVSVNNSGNISGNVSGNNSGNNSPFDSYNHAVTVRDDLIAQLDAAAETASDELYTAIRDVQAAFSRHIEAHGFKLERIASYSVDVSVPALVVAHSLYADASREADVVRRNNVEYPNFVPSGVPLEVLDA